MSYMENAHAFADGIEELSWAEIDCVGGGASPAVELAKRIFWLAEFILITAAPGGDTSPQPKPDVEPDPKKADGGLNA